jgi:acyl carrier protein
MSMRDDVVEAIYEAIRRTNEARPPEAALTCSEDTVFFGQGGSLDSLGLVSLILDVEELVNARWGTALVLADERAVAQRRNPFRDVTSLADHVMSRLMEAGACETSLAS